MQNKIFIQLYIISKGCSVDPCDQQVLGAYLQQLEGYTIKSELDYILHFLPIQYTKETIILNTNKYRKKQDPRWTDVDFDEVLHVLGLLIAMEVYKIHGPRGFY